MKGSGEYEGVDTLAERELQSRVHRRLMSLSGLQAALHSRGLVDHKLRALAKDYEQQEHRFGRFKTVHDRLDQGCRRVDQLQIVLEEDDDKKEERKGK